MKLTVSQPAQWKSSELVKHPATTQHNGPCDDHSDDHFFLFSHPLANFITSQRASTIMRTDNFHHHLHPCKTSHWYNQPETPFRWAGGMNSFPHHSFSESLHHFTSNLLILLPSSCYLSSALSTFFIRHFIFTSPFCFLSSLSWGVSRLW